ncbi:ArtA-dependent S-layer glycoprotein [Haloferax larsenii]|uniref:PGF-CTERM protein/surface glycoprotein n=1 Tax=Haloferax larsenii TaxID=302484 RepID=A0A1H7HCS1_HALLR|nr:ArtA-dependent S-layer glycoprotein [Haloferax larsenii]SEK48061.1 PGF-CTERM protein/surface glycoprotein [Haloferax larsenii]
MTRNKQIRAVLLSALMVLSVFAGSIAFTGTAAATAQSVSVGSSTSFTSDTTNLTSVTVQDDATGSGDGAMHVFVDENGNGAFDSGEANVSNSSYSANPVNFANLSIAGLSEGDYTVHAFENASLNDGDNSFDSSVTISIDDTKPSLLSAIHYQNGSAKADGEVEVAFDENVKINSINLTDGEDFSDTSEDVNDNGRVVFQLSDVYTQDLEVEYTVEDDAGNEVSGTEDVTFAPVYVSGTNNNTAYKGSTVAVVSNNTNEDVAVEAVDEDNDYVFDGSTGTNSKVFLFDTSDRELDSYEFEFDSQTSSVDVRDLGLEVSVDDLNITDEDALEGSITANADGRTVDVVALDDDGDEVDGASQTLTLDGQGEADFDLGTLDAGDYTVEVTDTFSGVTVESDTVSVSKAKDSTSNFGTSVVTEQVGDIAEITVTMEGTDEVDVMIGGDNLGYTANATVEDGNDDGEVILLFNTYDADDADSFSVDDSDDSVTIEDANISTGVTTTLDAGDYDLEVSTGGDADNVGTLVLEERSTTSQKIWTAPTGADLTETEDVYDAIDNGNLTESDAVANGDFVVQQVSATGLEGAFDESDFDALTGSQFNVTVEQTNPGPNREAKVLGINSTSATVIADGDNDTYFIAYDLDDVSSSRTDYYDSNADQLAVEDDDAFNATFTVLEDGDLAEDDESVSAEYDVVEPTLDLDQDEFGVAAAAEQTVSGTASVAPGTALTIRVKSDGDTQPRFLKTSTAYVQADGTFSSAFDFSEQNENDTFEVTVSVDSGSAEDASADGVVGAAAEQTTSTPAETTDATETATETATATATATATETATEAATEEPAEETTESSTPGFGIAVALVALVAAALLAVRRD